MPSLPVKTQQPSPVSPQVEMPPEFPRIPQEILDRFPSAKDWQTRLDEFHTRTKQSIEQAQTQAANYANSRVTYSVDSFRIYAKNGIPQPMFALDSTGIKLGDVLVISTVGRKVYIGEGQYADAQTPFYVDTLGRFSLGANLAWDPDTATLTITGIINATSGTIGGFTIGADFIRDTANSFGLASTVTGSDDVRFWAGAVFADRGIAPLRIYESGAVYLGAATGQSLALTGGAVNAIELTGVTVSNGPTGVFDRRTLSSVSTTYAYGFVTELATSAVVFTLPILSHFSANQGTFGAGSVVTVQTGFEAAATLTGAATNYGFRGLLAAAAGRYNLYMDGTAQNYLAGITGIGVAASATTRLILAAGTTGLSSLRMPHGAAPSAPVDGDCWTTTAGIFVQINGVTVGPLS